MSHPTEPFPPCRHVPADQFAVAGRGHQSAPIARKRDIPHHVTACVEKISLELPVSTIPQPNTTVKTSRSQYCAIHGPSDVGDHSPMITPMSERVGVAQVIQ